MLTEVSVFLESFIPLRYLRQYSAVSVAEWGKNKDRISVFKAFTVC